MGVGGHARRAWAGSGGTGLGARGVDPAAHYPASSWKSLRAARMGETGAKHETR